MTDEDTFTSHPDAVFHYWFVQYNPLYFFSALCVLAGMYLLTGDVSDWWSGQVTLALVMQAYELLLIASAALLYRAPGQQRPAVILGILCAFFYLDPTLRTEGLASIAPHAGLLAALWVGAAMLKLAALAWAFQLRAPWWAYTMPVLSAAAIATIPHWLAVGGLTAERAFLAASWFGCVLVIMAIWARPILRCRMRLSPRGHIVLHRATRAAFWCWAGFYLYHLFIWAGIYSVSLSVYQILPFLALLPLAARRESHAWLGAVVALGISSLEPAAISLAATIVGIALLWQGRHLRCRRLYVAAVLAFYLGGWTQGLETLVWPEPMPWLNLLAATILLAMGWWWRLGSAPLGAALCSLPGLSALLPQTAFQWGSTMLGWGFIALLAGIIANLYTTDMRPSQEAGTGRAIDG